MLRTSEKGLFKITGFYGSYEESPNGLFNVYFSGGHMENDVWINGKVALIQNKQLLFTIELQRPNDCKVSNNGTIICCNWLDWSELAGCFKVYDNKGKELISIQTKANLGNNAISLDSKIGLVETHYSDNEDGNKIYLIDIPNCKIIAKIERPTSFIEAKIDSEHKRIILFEKEGIEYEIDFDGNQTNFREHYKKIIENGNANDIVSYFYGKPKEDKFADKNYLDALIKSSTVKNRSSGLDIIYREIGEFYEFWGEIEKTIEYWIKALDLNPKVGVKRRLDRLRPEK